MICRQPHQRDDVPGAGALLEDCDLAIVNRYGTFASQRDYKAAMTPAHDDKAIYEKCSKFNNRRTTCPR